MQESKKEKSGGYDFRSKGTADQTLMIETMQFITYYNVKRSSLWGRGSRRGPQRRGQRCHTELAFKVLYSSASAASREAAEAWFQGGQGVSSSERQHRRDLLSSGF